MRRAILFLALLALAAAYMTAPAFAHQPYCEFADLTADSPWQVPDAAISYAYFGNVYPAGDIDYFAFDAEAGQPVLLSLSIPAIPELEVFLPVLLLSGPGIEADMNPPPAIAIPPGHGALQVPLGEAPVYWFEPFGRRYFWNWDDFIFTAPETATYRVALWHRADEIGRYAFVIGRKEVFGGEADCFASYGEYWTPLVAGQNPYRDTPDETLMAMRTTSRAGTGAVEVAARDAPQVFLSLIPMPGGGFNARTQTLNFTFAPQNADGPAVMGEGHAHLYLDGSKIARVYGEWHYLESLPAGAERLTVALYGNDHSAYTLDGRAVSDTVPLAEVLGGPGA